MLSTVVLLSRVVNSGVKSIWVICCDVGGDSGWSTVVSTVVLWSRLVYISVKLPSKHHNDCSLIISELCSDINK